MESKVRTILVLWDFTVKAEYAFAHAVDISKMTGDEISLLHVTKKGNEIATLEKKLSDIAEKLEAEYLIKPKVVVLKGSIFKTISKYASESNIELVIMGTHGVSGMQKVTGSRALRVVHGSRSPFLIVQEKPQSPKIENILFPIDFKKENKEKIKWAHYLCKLYRSRIYIVHPISADRLFRKNIHSNIIFTRKYFENADIYFEIKSMGKKVDFEKEMVEYAKKINANLILIMAPKALTLADYIMGPAEQKVIANEAKIPVMVINPKPKEFSGSFSATGG